MARIRTIKPEMFQDEKLASLDVTTRFVFVGLIAMADDMGRILDNPRVMDAFIFPETDDSVRESVANLSRMGRVRRGKTASGQRILQIVNWERHQRVDKPQLKNCFPEIVEDIEVNDVPESFANDSRTIREPLAPHTSDHRPPTADHRPGSRRAVARRTPAPAQLSADIRGSEDVRTEPKFPHFPKALSDAAYQAWQSKAGAVVYARFRKAFAPLFTAAEADRPAGYPRDAELVPAVRLYLNATVGTREAAFRSVEKCAGSIANMVDVLRTTDDPLVQLEHAQLHLGMGVPAGR